MSLADLLAPGLWWLHGTRGSNVFVVEADDGQLALVDTGFASSAIPILEEVRAHDRPLAAILLTHKHRDHSGAAAEVRSATGASVMAGRGDCFQRDGSLFVRAAVGRTHVGRLLLAALRRGSERDVPVDRGLEGELEVLPGIRAVPVPGHTPGSYCFVVERLDAAFVGDLVISHRGELTRAMRMANHDDERYLESIRQFAATTPGRGLPGHGTPVLDGFGIALRELAALPRRRTSPRALKERAVRMVRFGHGMSRPRQGAAPGSDDTGA